MIILKNKKGFSYVLVCVFILAAVLLTFVALQYASIYHIAREQKQDTQLTLDSYVTTYAVNKYNDSNREPNTVNISTAPTLWTGRILFSAVRGSLRLNTDRKAMWTQSIRYQNSRSAHLSEIPLACM